MTGLVSVGKKQVDMVLEEMEGGKRKCQDGKKERQEMGKEITRYAGHVNAAVRRQSITWSLKLEQDSEQNPIVSSAPYEQGQPTALGEVRGSRAVCFSCTGMDHTENPFNTSLVHVPGAAASVAMHHLLAEVPPVCLRSLKLLQGTARRWMSLLLH